MFFKSILLAALIGVLCAGSVFADEMPFALTTTGAFSGLTGGSSLGFSGSSASGATVSGESGALSLGQFSLSRPSSFTVVPYLGTFNLAVTFSVPALIVGGQTGNFSALVVGVVTSSAGGVMIAFGPPRTFNFSNPQGSGAFSFGVGDIPWLSAGPSGSPATRTLVGSISGASFTPAGSDPGQATPEPATVLFLLSGVVGIYAARKRFVTN